MGVALKLAEVARQHGAEKASQFFRESITERKCRLEDFSVREFAQATMGDMWYQKLKESRFKESSEAVDSSFFTAITGQLLVDRVKEKYQYATEIGNQIFDVEPITNGNLSTHIIPYLSNVVDRAQTVNQGMEYPMTQFKGQYITAPAPEKFGQILNLTFETIYSDLTGQMFDSAGSVGRQVGLDEEYRKLDVFLGIVNNHSWNGTSYDSYQTATPWINKVTSFTLTDWTSINDLEQLFYQMMDPVTDKPIDIEPKDMFVMPANKYTARRVLNATETRSGDITTGSGNQNIASNPLDRNYKLLWSAHARKRLVDNSVASPDRYVLLGDFKKTFAWRQVFPMTVTQAPPQNPLEFTQDIVYSVKANVFGVAYVKDPRYTVLATA